jgi:acetyltransferase
MSHTGALAGRESAFNAAFRRAGVIRAETSEELFDWARALAWCPPPKGRSVAVLTDAGGPGVTAADALEANGMRLATLSEPTRAALSGLLPPEASLHNPVDMLASAGPEQYAGCLRVLLDDANVHGALVILPPPPMHTAGAVAKALIPVIHASEKPVVVALMGERLIQEAVEHFRAARVPEYRFPERAASALAVLAQRAEFLERPVQPSADLLDLDRQKAGVALQTGQDSQPSGGFMSFESLQPILEAYGIPVLSVELARSSEEAVCLAQKLGYPVALKVVSPDIPHKSDVGGVLLNVRDERGVAEGFIAVTHNSRSARPEARIEGVHVQRMLPEGQEVIVGAVRDLHFGPLVMFGSGGVEVEGLKDVAFALAPCTREEAEHLLESTWAGRKLSGYRNILPADREAALEVVLRVAQLAADFPEIAEVEINPLRVLANGEGAYALDGRAVKLLKNTLHQSQ